jgi:hypothetical protein
LAAGGATAHYLSWSSGNRAHSIGWLLGMLFLLLALLPQPRELAASLKSLIRPKTAFFLFWILFFVVSHLWNFQTAPWNGDGLFDESGWDPTSVAVDPKTNRVYVADPRNSQIQVFDSNGKF